MHRKAQIKSDQSPYTDRSPQALQRLRDLISLKIGNGAPPDEELCCVPVPKFIIKAAQSDM